MSKGKLYDVIVAGAGPVGILLACELGLAGASVLVLESYPDLESPWKGWPLGLRGMNSLTVEALYRRGLMDKVSAIDKGAWGKAAAERFDGKLDKKDEKMAGQDEKTGIEQTEKIWKLDEKTAKLEDKWDERWAKPAEKWGKPKEKTGKPRPQFGNGNFAGHFAAIMLESSKLDLDRWKYRLEGPALRGKPTTVEAFEKALSERAESLGVTILRGAGVTKIAKEDVSNFQEEDRL
jgi:choline dehydrogenase-like flavoprotein